MIKSTICCKTDKLERMGEKYIHFLVTIYANEIVLGNDVDFYLQIYEDDGTFVENYKQNTNEKFDVSK